MLGKGLTLFEYHNLTIAAGKTQFMVALDQAGWNAYWCEEGAFTPDLESWSGLMDIYEVLPSR